MKHYIILYCMLLLFTILHADQVASNNQRPIIGIVSERGYQDADYSYIAASYVKFVESAGARVVPILCNSTTEQLTKLFSSINGVLFPGGGSSLNNSDYLRCGKVLYNLSVQAFYDSGDYFPIWGTCLGMELLMTIQHGSSDILSSFDSEDYTIPLNMTSSDAPKNSRLLSFYNDTALKWLTTEPLTMNNHRYGIDPMWFDKDDNIKRFYQSLTTNLDKQGKEFVSTIEAFNVPIYGVQWHPEKNIFEWNPNLAMKHSYHAVRIAQIAADFFVEESRKNSHQFPSEQEERDSLIYNYSPIYEAKIYEHASFEQVYRFPCC